MGETGEGKKEMGNYHVHQDDVAFHFRCLLECNESSYSRIKHKLNSLLKEQKRCSRSNKAVFFGHQGLGDFFIMTGAIRYLAMMYDEIVVLAIESYKTTLTQMFADDSSIRFVFAPDFDSVQAQYNILHYPSPEYSLLGVGWMKHGCWPSEREPFYQAFYRDLHLPWEYHTRYFHVHREPDEEQALFEATVGRLQDGEPYIFVHDKENVDFSFLTQRTPEICVYHPSRNYYTDSSHKFHGIWSGYQDNVLLYTKIIENASEIYVIDSAFFSYTAHLSSLKAVKKRVYALRCFPMDDYVTPESGWEIVSG